MGVSPGHTPVVPASLPLRRPAGTPSGGQFAAGIHLESTLLLDGRCDFAALLDHPAVDAVAERFAGAGVPLYVVGGGVRDLLDSGRAGHDIDMSTPADVAATRTLLGGLGDFDPAGEPFGTVRCILDADELGLDRQWDVEVTTFRGETYQEGSRKPQVGPVTSVIDDLARRDFTINAMALNTATGVLVDPFNGRGDLARGVLRAVGDPDRRFREDPLRILRAVRFAATRPDWMLDAGTAEAAARHADALVSVSRERCRDELVKTLSHPSPTALTRAISFAEQVGASDDFFGGLNWRGARVFDTDACTTVESRLALLASQTSEPGPALTAAKFDRQTVASVTAVASKAVALVSHPTPPVRELRRVLRNFNDDQTAAVREVATALHGLEAAVGLRREAAQAALWRRPRPVDGHDAMRAGISGASIAAALRAVDDALLDSPDFGRSDALDLLAGHAAGV